MPAVSKRCPVPAAVPSTSHAASHISPRVARETLSKGQSHPAAVLPRTLHGFRSRCRQAPPSAHKTGRAWPPQLLLSPHPVSPLHATQRTPCGSRNCPSTRPLHWFFPGLCPAHPLTFLGLYKCLCRETLPPSNITGLSHSVVSLHSLLL